MQTKHRHILLDATHMRLSGGPKAHYTRPAADPLFISAAESHDRGVIGIVLSGGDGDGAADLLAIKQHGGKAFVQDPGEAIARFSACLSVTQRAPAPIRASQWHEACAYDH